MTEQMTREQAKQYLKNHSDPMVKQALDILCLTASLDTVEITISVDNEKKQETIESLVGAGILAKVEQMRNAHKAKYEG